MLVAELKQLAAAIHGELAEIERATAAQEASLKALNTNRGHVSTAGEERNESSASLYG